MPKDTRKFVAVLVPQRNSPDGCKHALADAMANVMINRFNSLKALACFMFNKVEQR